MLVLWVLANAVYVDMRRAGEKGFKRLAAFWLGWPGTFVGMFAVDEGSQPAVRHDDRDLRALVEEVRQDRLDRGDALYTRPERLPGGEPPPHEGDP